MQYYQQYYHLYVEALKTTSFSIFLQNVKFLKKVGTIYLFFIQIFSYLSYYRLLFDI